MPNDLNYPGDWIDDQDTVDQWGVGELEEDRFVNSFHKMKDSLSKRCYQEFEFKSLIYQGHHHSSYIKEGIRDGLTFLLKKESTEN